MTTSILPVHNTVNVHGIERALSIVGGSALTYYALERKHSLLADISMLLGGAGLITRGLTGHCHTYALLGVNTGSAGPVHVFHSVTVRRSAEELYRFWRGFDRLPKFMEHLEEVTVESPTRSHWVAKAPFGARVEWDAEITADEPGKRISWRSVPTPRTHIHQNGTVSFREEPADRGTVVKVEIDYVPPAGMLGVGVAKLLGREPSQQITSDLRRFKALMEAGELPRNA